MVLLTLNHPVIPAEDLRFGRLLLRATSDELARCCRLSRPAVSRLENGEDVHPDTYAVVAQALVDRGVVFGALTANPGHVELNGRRAPTVAAVGQLTGPRLARARERLALTPQEVAFSARHATPAFVRRVEKLVAVPKSGLGEIMLVQVFGALEVNGYRFARDAREDKVVRQADA